MTSHVCKVLEALIRDAIVQHLEVNESINKSQHGFMKHRSCLTNLLEFFEDVTSFVDKGDPVDVIFLDFQKAFDKVPHKRLLKKVKTIGIGGEIYSWLEDWLKDRKQRVCLGGVSSDWVKVSSGVPQGSVLGPLLFLIYINDIDDDISSKILKFADDTKLYRNVATVNDIEQLSSDLDKLMCWSQEWMMLFNVDKCKVMHIGHRNAKVNYKMNGMALEEIQEERDLGVLVQNDLKCGRQCAKVVHTANRVLGLIRRRFRNF